MVRNNQGKQNRLLTILMDFLSKTYELEIGMINVSKIRLNNIDYNRLNCRIFQYN